MNLNLEQLEKLYKESDNLMSKINSIDELCEPAYVQKVKEQEFVFKLWANQIINKLYHFETDKLPLTLIELINKCIEFNLIYSNNYQMLKRYSNLPDHQLSLEASQLGSIAEDKFINSTLYSKLRKILQIDDSQYFVDGMVGNALLDLNGDFVWMDQQAQDIFEIPTLKDGGVNFFDMLIDESKRKLYQKLGNKKKEQIQLLDPETMENSITYIIFSKNKQKKVHNFMRKKNIKKMNQLNDQYFFNLYLKCLVSHLQLTQVFFNIKNLNKEFNEIQAEDPSHFEDKKINKIEDQFQNELNLPFFKNAKKKGSYLIKMSTKISKSIPKLKFRQTQAKLFKNSKN